MTTLREVAQQALEALETVFMPHHPAVISLRAALEQPEQERFPIIRVVDTFHHIHIVWVDQFVFVIFFVRVSTAVHSTYLATYALSYCPDSRVFASHSA